MTQDRGIALLNALIMVAAISAVAAGLMLRAETSRSRVEHVQISEQAMLHLDAAELLIDPVLRADWEADQNLDHLLEGWALERFGADIDRAQLAGQITDLQGLFNVNALSDPGDLAAVQAFERLLRGLGLPVALAREVAGFVQARGPVLVEEYSARDIPLRPPGGPIAGIEELRLVRGMTSEDYARLLPFVSALPVGSSLNVNTTPAAVLGAVLPTANPAGVERLVADRGRVPFANAGDFRQRAETLLHPRVIEQSQAPNGGLGVTSRWFQVRFDLALDGRILSRIVTVERSTLTGATDIKNRRADPL
ncbi:general secretion pathway protein K [Roseovarius lutimaris]|uniref:Type II secretion system protein K n=1 Tax=Roseovarius lutimaris TaxID=1005928 RepID=A0A1I5DR03_9RHOB|nr:type II secretion system minor pseudopilin GspK [Roseovarius lutimaris]SFO01695.1 general secretion pathway protein K [Roseovarius lutimaris]